MAADISVFDLFKIGIGPSSSHTVGPMKAARLFVRALQAAEQLHETKALHVELFGSLALTGKGHGTDHAILLGLEGEEPDKIDPDEIEGRLANIRSAQALALLKRHAVAFEEKRDLLFHYNQNLPLHPNGMRFTAFAANQKILDQQVYYSVGGGFVMQEDEISNTQTAGESHAIPFPFNSGEELLRLGREHNLAIHQLVLENEKC